MNQNTPNGADTLHRSENCRAVEITGQIRGMQMHRRAIPMRGALFRFFLRMAVLSSARTSWSGISTSHRRCKPTTSLSSRSRASVSSLPMVNCGASWKPNPSLDAGRPRPIAFSTPKRRNGKRFWQLAVKVHERRFRRHRILDCPNHAGRRVKGMEHHRLLQFSCNGTPEYLGSPSQRPSLCAGGVLYIADMRRRPGKKEEVGQIVITLSRPHPSASPPLPASSRVS